LVTTRDKQPHPRTFSAFRTLFTAIMRPMAAGLRRPIVGVALLTFCAAGAMAGSDAQRTPEARTFRTRLSPVPIDLTMRAAIAGEGSVTATLSGRTLTIAGTFKDLKSPATLVRLHRSPNRGLRGPAIGELKADAATSGTITGTVALTAEQVQDLQRGRLYVQLHSETAPDGNLWGWLGEAKVRSEK
jgi:hypothetical protein